MYTRYNVYYEIERATGGGGNVIDKTFPIFLYHLSLSSLYFHQVLIPIAPRFIATCSVAQCTCSSILYLSRALWYVGRGKIEKSNILESTRDITSYLRLQFFNLLYNFIVSKVCSFANRNNLYNDKEKCTIMRSNTFGCILLQYEESILLSTKTLNLFLSESFFPHFFSVVKSNVKRDVKKKW